MPHDRMQGALAEIGGKQEATPRCRACQLQLCKSRREAPHASLKEILREEDGRFVRYACQSCGATLLCSENLSVPGWTVSR
jgi:uncharacterized protein with PIN domain